jgi:hypothetical protein
VNNHLILQCCSVLSMVYYKGTPYRAPNSLKLDVAFVGEHELNARKHPRLTYFQKLASTNRRLKLMNDIVCMYHWQNKHSIRGPLLHGMHICWNHARLIEIFEVGEWGWNIRIWTKNPQSFRSHRAEGNFCVFYLTYSKEKSKNRMIYRVPLLDEPNRDNSFMRHTFVTWYILPPNIN